MKVNDQVMVRKDMRNGARLVRIGSIVRLDTEAGVAEVHFPNDYTKAVLPIEKLELTSNRFSGRSRVQVDPAKRMAR